MNIICGMPGAVQRRNRVSHNLLPLNVQTGTDTLGDTTGFAIRGNNTIISSSIDESYQGSKSLKCVTNNDAAYEGTYVSLSGLPTSTKYSCTLYVKGSGTCILSLAEYTSVMGFVGETLSAPFNISSSWQKFSVNRTFGDTGVNGRFNIVTNSKQGVTFYVDALEIRRVIP